MAKTVDRTGIDSSLAEISLPQPGPAAVDEAIQYLHQSQPSDCDICQPIMRDFLTPFSNSYHVDLGPAGAVLSRECSAHFPLLADLKENFESNTGGFVKVSL
jgi:hypothetical protein